MLEEWLKRVDNMLELQLFLQCETMTASFTRHELVELRMIIEAAEAMNNAEVQDGQL